MMHAPLRTSADVFCLVLAIGCWLPAAAQTPAVRISPAAEPKAGQPKAGQPKASSRCTPQQAFANLERGTPVAHVIRLLAFDPTTEPQLSITRLETLGAPRQRFIFVADHAELVGDTVTEALAKVGRTLRPGQHVSAMIYPRGDRQVLPANARGVLQAIQDVDRLEAQHPHGAPYRPADLSKHLRPDEIEGLADRSPRASAWASFQQNYQSYDQAVRSLRDERCSAFDLIGTIDRDWRALGYARRAGTSGSPPAANFTLPLKNETLKIENFGARVFLTANEKLADLPGLWLIDFDRPDIERIPAIEPVAK